MQVFYTLSALCGAALAWENCVPTHYEDWVPRSERTAPNGADSICWKQVQNENFCHLWMKCHYDTFGIGYNNAGEGPNTGGWCPKTCAMLEKYYPRQACTEHHRIAVQRSRWNIDEDSKTVCYTKTIPFSGGQTVQQCQQIEGQIVDVHPYGTAHTGASIEDIIGF